MKKQLLYMGIQLVLATAMTLDEYESYSGFEVPTDDDCIAHDDGFLVEHVDGGSSNHPNHNGPIDWYPDFYFNDVYKRSGEMSFGMAIEAARNGFKVSRTSWNGSGMFAYIVAGNSYPAQMDAIKGEFPGDMVPYNEYWAIRTANGVNTWAPSGSDSLANDWVIHES